jgi:predicted nucleic acid-binding protein
VPFALDASAALAWMLPEESPAAEQARARIATDNALVPALWWFELRNGLIINERRGRITEDEAADFLHRVDQFAIAVDDAPGGAALMALARRHRLTAYDAAYLELALREGVPLATLDGSLAAAARAEGVPVLGE